MSFFHESPLWWARIHPQHGGLCVTDEKGRPVLRVSKRELVALGVSTYRPYLLVLAPHSAVPVPRNGFWQLRQARQRAGFERLWAVFWERGAAACERLLEEVSGLAALSDDEWLRLTRPSMSWWAVVRRQPPFAVLGEGASPLLFKTRAQASAYRAEARPCVPCSVSRVSLSPKREASVALSSNFEARIEAETIRRAWWYITTRGLYATKEWAGFSLGLTVPGRGATFPKRPPGEDPTNNNP